MLKLYFIIGVIICAAASGRVIREAPNTDVSVQTPDISLQTVFTIAENGLKKLQEVVLESLNVANTDELQSKAKERGESVLNQLKTWATDIKKTTDEWQDNVSVKELREIVDNAIEGFKAEHPKLTSEVTGYVDNVTKTSEKIIEQIKEISKSDESNQIKELSEKLLETTKQSFVLIGNQIKDVSPIKDSSPV